MATIQFPIEVLDEKCMSCRAIDLEKTELYYGAESMITQYQCRNLHLCQYIRNRIVRNEDNKEEKKNG